MNIEKQKLQKAIDNSLSMADVLRNLNLPEGGGYRRKLKKLIEIYGLDVSSLDGRKATIIKNTVWKTIEKECPVCKQKFETKLNHPKEKITCGYSCSNTYFRMGEGNPNWKEVTTRYRDVCFEVYPEECIVCGEKEVVDVHHIDGDRSNNQIENLIPLCPTHHAYMHRGKSHLIQETIDKRKMVL